MMARLAPKEIFRLLVAIVAIVATSAPALAFCTQNGGNATVISGGTSATVAPAYSSSAVADQIHTFTVTIANPRTNANATCDLALSFTRSSLPATMTNGAATLEYSIESTSGATLIQTTGFAAFASPQPANRIDLTIAPGGTADVSVRIRIPAGQTSATAGNYADSSVTVGIYELAFGVPWRVLDEQVFTVNASITSGCTLPAPDTSKLNFTPAISAGLPNPGFILRSTFNGVSCSAPSRIRLTGSALVATPATGTVAGFDNEINYLAIAQFGAASAALNSNVAMQVTSAGTNVVSGAVSGTTITVDVNLLAGQPIIAGSYSSVLTVTIDPSL
ncbi:MAG: hypothetical protein KJ587_01515 [Alphaproteobacteria bacterium]|nr:hypothetical protein [Alphaproteobacteria bacterium]